MRCRRLGNYQLETWGVISQHGTVHGLGGQAHFKQIHVNNAKYKTMKNLLIQAQSGHTFCNISNSKDPHKSKSIATNRSSNKTDYISKYPTYHCNNSSIIHYNRRLHNYSTQIYAAKMPHRCSNSPMNSVNTACMSRASVLFLSKCSNIR